MGSNEILYTISFLLIVFVGILVFQKALPSDPLEGVGCTKELKEHTESFPKEEIIKVLNGVYVAVGFALANSILIECKEGAIIIDTTESLQAATRVAAGFAKITSKPVLDVIYTHSHQDHITGTAAFIKGDKVRIWAHKSFEPVHVQTLMSGRRVYCGAVGQFGTQLGEHRADCGIGFQLQLDPLDAVPYPLLPNKLIQQDYETHLIQGLNITFLHIPGETADHLGIWIDDWKLLMPGDDIYRTFPNLYAIRGTPPRSSLQWAESLEKIRKLGAEHLIPSHILPVSGKTEIFNLFTVYMSAIRFVHDQTLRFLNKGWHPEDIAQHLQLPRKIREHPYIREFYGKIIWSSKAVSENYIGWFGGDPVDLQPLLSGERAKRYIKLVGENKIVKETLTALKTNDNQWALELSSLLFKFDPSLNKYKNLRLEALRQLAEKETNPLARHFYLTEALKMFDKIDYQLSPKNTILSTNLDNLFKLMTTKVKAESIENVNTTVIFRFTDLNVSYKLSLQHSVLLVEKMAGLKDVSFDLRLTTTSLVWRQLMAQLSNPLAAYWRNDIKIEGGLFAFRNFMSNFEKSDE